MTERGGRRVLFVAYYFPPRGGAGVQRSLKFVKYLRRFGWEPTVLTTEYPKGSGAYDEALLAEVPEGVKVVRVPSREGFFVALAKVGLGRLTGLFLRPDAVVGWVKNALAAACALHGETPFDLVYTSVQPWSAALVGMKLKAKLSVPWVCDFRDPWTTSLHLEWPSRAHWLRDLALEGRILAEADRTLVVTPTMKDEFLASHELPEGRIKVLYNGFDEEDFAAPVAGDDGAFTIVFTGRFQHDHRDDGPRRRLGAWLRGKLTYKPRAVGMDTHSPVYFFEGLARFLARRPDSRRLVRVVLAGQIGRGNMELADRAGLSDVVESPGYLPHTEATALVRSADALLLPMFSTPDENERIAYASGKVFEYLAARKPILALAQAGDARDLAVESGAGVAVAPRDVGAIADAIEGLFDRWRSGCVARPDEDFVSRFTRERLTGELAGVFDEVLAESRRAQ